jgi:hypothetical protein
MSRKSSIRPAPRWLAPSNTLIPIIVIAGLVILLYASRPAPSEPGPPGAIPIEIDETILLDQNGQSLINEGAPETASPEPVQSTPTDPLQGSSSTQSAASVGEIPPEWLE